MGTRFRGTFVISWSQTEIDGLKAAPLDVLAVGAAWRWSGQPVQVDGGHGPLILEGAKGVQEMRRRAARMVRRLIGAAVTGAAADVEPMTEAEAEDASDQGFIVTDGHESWSVTLLPVPDTGASLLMFVGELPPPDQDLWIVRAAVDRTETGANPREGGASSVLPPAPGSPHPRGCAGSRRCGPAIRF